MYVPGGEEWKPLQEPVIYVWNPSDGDFEGATAFDCDEIEDAVMRTVRRRG